jgi:predicted permease
MDEARLALRRLTKHPAATLASIATLACAIGAAAATWSLVDRALIRPLPVADPARVMIVGIQVTDGPRAGTLQDGFIYPIYPIVRDSGIFEAVVAEWAAQQMPVDTAGVPAPAGVAFASARYFDMLGIPIAIGRGFSQHDDRRGAAAVAVLTESYWRRAFNADPSVIGRTLTINRKVITIVGVAARGFRGLDLARATEIYIPLETIADVGSPMTNYFADTSRRESPTAGVRIIVRLAPGASAAEAAERLKGLDVPRRGPGIIPFGFTNISTAAIPPAGRGGMRQFTTLLAATVGLLLLIGCTTVGMLLLIRTEARREEMAMCLALGASRGRLVRGVALEGLLLSLGGVALSWPAALWIFRGIRTFQLPGGVEVERLELTPDAGTFVISAIAAVLSTALIALIAGGFGLSANIGDALRSRAGATPRVGRRWTRLALVSGQVAVALVLLAGAGLFARSLRAALNLNADVRMSHLLSTSVSLDRNVYSTSTAGAFFDDLLGRLHGIPSIQSVASSEWQGGMTPSGTTTIDGVPRKFPSMVSLTAVDPNYFGTVGLTVLRGRDFSSTDGAGAQRVVIISESLGRMMANGGNPIGSRIRLWSSRPGGQPDVLAVVGVASDVVTNVSILEPLDLYVPMAQSDPGLSRTVNVRAALPDSARRDILGAVKAIDPAVAPGPMRTLEQRIDGQMRAQRFGAIVLGALGGIAALLTILGTFVTAESMAVMRTREMGIRAALGATRAQLGAIVMGETLRLVGIGLAVGLGLAWLGGSTIRSLLFQIRPLDTVTLSAAAAAILTIALLVSLRPALRAARVDLATVLKEQ